MHLEGALHFFFAYEVGYNLTVMTSQIKGQLYAIQQR